MDNGQSNYAVYAQQKVNGIRETFFRSHMFLAICILETLVAVFSVVTLLIGLFSLFSFLAIEELFPVPEELDISFLIGLEGVSLGLLGINTIMWGISTVGAWQLYSATGCRFDEAAWKKFKVLFVHLATEGALLAIGCVAVGAYMIFQLLATPGLMIALLAVAAVSVFLLVLPFYHMYQYLNTLPITFRTGMAPCEKIPFVGLMVYGICCAVLELVMFVFLESLEVRIGFFMGLSSIVNPMLFILLPLFFYKLHVELTKL
ncbi:MAG: hypothetical protein IJW29_04720 [Clostridia bacterium]|nr:hypothetical protein [Clostridia bacterium]